jgi:SET domain-containing protein
MIKVKDEENYKDISYREDFYTFDTEVKIDGVVKGSYL